MKVVYDLIIPIGLVIGLVVLAGSSIKKHSKVYYGIASLIAIISSGYEINKIIIHGDKLTGIIYRLERISLKGFVAL